MLFCEPFQFLYALDAFHRIALLIINKNLFYGIVKCSWYQRRVETDFLAWHFVNSLARHGVYKPCPRFQKGFSYCSQMRGNAAYNQELACYLHEKHFQLI